MPVTHEIICHLEKQSLFTLTEQEREQLVIDFNAIMERLDGLCALDLEGIAPLIQPFDVAVQLREDIVTDSLPRDSMLQNAAHHNDEYFIAPRVME